MFKNVVSLFNFDESNNEYYLTILENVELQSNYRTRFTNDSTLDDDVSLLIIKYSIVDSDKKISSGKVFKTPKIWEKLENKSDFFTFQPGSDFFMKGRFEKQISDYEALKNSYDDVFFIHSVKDFEDDLKHWEVTGY